MRVKRGDSESRSAGVALSRDWDILGPFQIGTREATWGADPLESHGGFSQLYPDAKSYPSSLGRQGKVGWSRLRAYPLGEHALHEISGGQIFGSAIKLVAQAQDVDWPALREVYGWAALQWQAWVRGILTIQGLDSMTVKIYLPAILEFEIDGTRYFGGDFFSYRNAPLILCLEPGAHTLNIRVVRDVRVSGGVGEPSVEFEIHVEATQPELVLEPHKALFPDFVKQYGYAGRICCIPVHNTGKDWLELVKVGAENPDCKAEFSLLDGQFVSIAPGQTKSIGIGFLPPSQFEAIRARLYLTYQWRGSKTIMKSGSFPFQGIERELYEPHKMVFKRPNGTISYALTVSPHPSSVISHDEKDALPVLAVLHGAGVEAESTQTRDMLKEMGSIPAWVIIPTGGTLWSGDDWHTWGLADVEASIAAIPGYISSINWSGRGVDLRNLYVAGHSNGGQGTWHMLTHIPDKIRAAAPVSGYLSIQKYVPYSTWNELDPKICGILHGSLTAYRHELLIDNAKGIPIQQQHGDADDNVPPIHSRRMYQLMQESGSDPQYHELPGKGHWDIDTMATPVLKSFYRQIGSSHGRHDHIPANFSIVIPSTGERIGSRGGIVVDQLHSLGQLGRINVERNSKEMWTIKTSNILRFHIGSEDYHGSYPKVIRIDEQAFDLESIFSHNAVGFWLKNGSGWMKASSLDWKSPFERSGPQYGTVYAVLRTRSELHVQYYSESAFSIAVQISRNLYQYFSANCNIVSKHHAPPADGNVISVMIGGAHLWGNQQISTLHTKYPIEICDQGIKLRTRSGLERLYLSQSKLGAIFLVPRADERLELVVWGYDLEGAQQAARLVPGLTGAGQPDFVIVGEECSWQGARGVLAMGFFEHDWTISESAYVS